MAKRRIMKEWSDSLASYYYEYQIFERAVGNHSCYSCYDDWSWLRKKCHNNCDRWDTKATGDKKWADNLAKHYKIKIGDTNE